MSFTAPRKLRILALLDENLMPPESAEGLTDKQIQPWKMEYDVITSLRSMGHEVHPVGLFDNLDVLRVAIEEFRPHIAFNLLEEFNGYCVFDQNIVGYLELNRLPYTGCNPRGLLVARDKALTKKLLAYHNIRVPAFAAFPLRRKITRPPRLKFPLFVKSIMEEGSVGIAQSSVVHDDQKLAERVQFVHRQTNKPAIAERYIAGREVYVGVLGNQRLQTFTPWELLIKNLPEGMPNIATGRVKWSHAYQEKAGVVTEPAKLDAEFARKLERLSKRIYRLLGLSGYARLDFRINESGQIYLLEANPNPNLAYGEDFSEAAEHGGLSYEALLHKIVNLGLQYTAQFQGF